MSSLQERTELPQIPVRPVDGHKGLFGKVMIVGGSEGMIGAPAFAGLAALRCGCGLAYIAADAKVLPFILTVAPECVGIPMHPDSMELLKRAIAGCDAVAAGPGMGKSEFAKQMLNRAMECSTPLLLDADALNLLAAGEVELRRPDFSTVLTPHPGEMQRLAGLLGVGEVPADEEGRIGLAARAADHFRQVVLLKGHRTVISDGRQYAINTTGDSTLSKAGSGDILSGIIATFLGQGIAPFEAAWLGAYCHGTAGEFAGRTLDRRSALARDILTALARVF